jgi:hypothetical protein
MSAADEVLNILYYAVADSRRMFNGQVVRALTFHDKELEIRIGLDDGWMVKVRVEERKAADRQVCGQCKTLKPGWPDGWRNIGGKGLNYVCHDCAEVVCPTTTPCSPKS